jgi:hypothetical protein
MSVSSVWVLHGVQTPSNFYSVLEDATPAPTIDAMVQFASGHPQPLFTAVRGLKPEIVFRTMMVGTAIAELGLFGADLSAGNVDLYYKKVTDHGVREAAASLVHLRLRMVNAFAYIRSIRAAHRQEGSCEVRVVSPYDGVNAPIVAAGSQALAGTPAAAEFYGLGPVSINSVAQGGVQDAQIELNPDVMELGDASETYDTFCAVRSIQPVVTVRGLDTAPWTAYGAAGAALSALSVYLRRKAPDGHNVADGTASHVKISGTSGLVTIDNSSGGGNTEVQTGVRIFCRATDSTVNAITLASGSAIT